MPPRGSEAAHHRDYDESSLIRLYLDDIGEFPLLTADEEIQYGQMVQDGLAAGTQLEEFLKNGGRERSLQSRELQKVIEDGETATRIMIVSNLRLVVDVAKRFRSTGVPLLDLVQLGNQGLLESVQRFEPDRGFRFSTYAVWWIRQAIQIGIPSNRLTVRFPRDVWELLPVIGRTREQLTAILGREPTEDEVCDRIGLTVHEYRRVMLARDWEINTLSFQQPVGDEGRELGDMVADIRQSGYGDVEDRLLYEQLLYPLLEGLSDERREALEGIFGLKDGVPRTFNEVGELYGVPDHVIRHRKRMALAHMRRQAAKMAEQFDDGIAPIEGSYASTK